MVRLLDIQASIIANLSCRHCAPGVGQILGGLLSFGFQNITVESNGIAGWRAMFLTLGILTLLIGVFVHFFLPNTPAEARFLSLEEKVALLRHTSVNMTGVANHKPRPREILEALRDPQLYLLILPGVFASMSSGLTGTYSTTLLKEDFKFSSRKSALLNMPNGAVG
jgi:sugar phosphate permease